MTFLEQLQETGVTDSLQVNDQQIVSLAILLSSQGEQNTGSDVTSNPQSASINKARLFFRYDVIIKILKNVTDLLNMAC